MPIYAEENPDVLRSIPPVPAEEKRLMTLEDLLALRDIDSLSVSPDGSMFAMLVRQAVPERNSHRTGWFVGSTAGGDLMFIGDGGEPRLMVRTNGRTLGELVGSPGRWSPDGQWVAYTVKRNDEIQLWRSRRDAGVREQLTYNAADVRDFVWSEDGRRLYFTADMPREKLRARNRAEAWRGYRYADHARAFDIITPGQPVRPLETNPQVWVVEVQGPAERPVNEQDLKDYDRLRSVGHKGGLTLEMPAVLSGLGLRPVVSSRKALAWLAPESDPNKSTLPATRITASPNADASNPISCPARECSGTFLNSLWWNADGSRLIFWNRSKTTEMESGLYSWSPGDKKVATLIPASGDMYTDCSMVGDRLICKRGTGVQPDHVVSIDTRSRKIAVIANANPEMKNIRFGRVERIEWDVPPTPPEAGYPPRAYGYVLYPPDFDPKRKYPVFLSPYSASNFHRGDVGDEQPMYAYAAHGIVVINTRFPMPSMPNVSDVEGERILYSSETGFISLATDINSTLRALDVVAQRGFIDLKRVGIGGLSRGAQIPLSMLQKEDRLTAVSIAGGYWSPPGAYYHSTHPHPDGNEKYEFFPAPRGEGLKWWYEIDVSQHVDQIEAPILFNIPDSEIFFNNVLLRHLADEKKAFDAYVFPDEYHIKWQSAHRAAIYRRNLDWFRFWLQDYEDPAAAKVEQYERWRELRELQCQNPRSLRDYCRVAH